MFVAAKTVLSSYGNLSRHIGNIEKLIEETALKSFYDPAPCEILAERIIGLIEKKNLLIDLKNKAKNALKGMCAEDVNLLADKFGKSRGNIYLSKSSYFRKLNAAVAQFGSALSRQGITEEVFKNEYADKIVFLGVKRKLMLDEENCILRRLKKLRPARISGSFREVAGD